MNPCIFLEMNESGKTCLGKTAPCFLDPPWCPLDRTDEEYQRAQDEVWCGLFEPNPERKTVNPDAAIILIETKDMSNQWTEYKMQF